MLVLDNSLQLANSIEFLARHQLARSIDWQSLIGISPHSHRVEILERQPERIHPSMAGVAQWLASMQLLGFADRRLMIFDRVAGGFQDRHIRWRRRWRRGSQYVVQDEQPALHWGSTTRIRCNAEQCPLREHAASGTSGRQLDAASRVSFYAVDPIVLRQRFVQEGVVTVDQLRH